MPREHLSAIVSLLRIWGQDPIKGAQRKADPRGGRP
jgi:hypothetical protein